jgi:hypothetical protein
MHFIASSIAAFTTHSLAEQAPFGAAEHVEHLAHNSLLVRHQMLHAPQSKPGIVLRLLLLRARDGHVAWILCIDSTCERARRQRVAQRR